LSPSVSTDPIPGATVYNADGSIAGTATTIIIPKGPPRGLLMLDNGNAVYADTGATGPYVVVTGNCTLAITLPAKGDLTPIPDVTMQGIGKRIVIDLDVPQTVVQFGGLGIKRSDPDFMAAYLMDHVLGGGAFSSRLYREVREKRGLAYGVSDQLLWLYHAAVHVGGTATRNDATKDTIEVIESEVAQMAKDGPNADELEKAKTYLKGSFALGLDTSTKISNQLVSMQLDNLGIDYIDRRSALIDAVTLDDTKRMAKRLLNGGMLLTVVGRPQGVTSK